jgi:thymidylate kinase
MVMNSKLVMFEGVDGSGKSTMINDLKEEIKEKNPKIKVQTMAFPNVKAFGGLKIRSILADKKAMNYPPDLLQGLYVLNMIETFEKTVNPFFEKNPTDAIMLIDRGPISTILYNAMNGGTIYHSIRTYLKRNRLAGDITISEDDSRLDLDIILNKYCHLKKAVDYYVFIQPPINVVLDRAAKRKSGEEFDSSAYVQRMYQAYNDFYTFISGRLNRSIMDSIEGPDTMVRPSSSVAKKSIRYDKWNDLLSDQENHKAYRDDLLKKILK